MKRELFLFIALVAGLLGGTHNVAAQDNNYDGWIDTLGSRLYYKLTDTNTISIVSPTYKYEDGQWKMWDGYAKPTDTLIIPDSIRHRAVVEIGYRAFYTCDSITHVFLPATIVSICEGAFESCTRLVEADMPNSVTSLGNAAYMNCISLPRCHISEGLTRISDYCFYMDSAMRVLVIPPTITTVGNSAFSGVKYLDSAFFMGGNISTGYYAFNIGGRVHYAKYIYSAHGQYNLQAAEVLEFGDDALDTVRSYTIQGFGRLVNDEGIVDGPGDLHYSGRKIIFGTGVKHFENSSLQYVDHLDTLVVRATTPPTIDDEFWISSQIDTVVVVTPCGAGYDTVWGFSKYAQWGNYVNFHFTFDGAYDLKVNTANRDMGTAEYVSAVDCEQTATVAAIPNEHYHLVSWSDGSTDLQRTITLTSDSVITATFAIDQHTLNVVCDDSTMGLVTGSGVFDYGTTTTITATSNAGHHFVRWSDSYYYGTTDPTRQITVSSDTTITAFFERNQYRAEGYVLHHSSHGTIEVSNEQPYYGDTVMFVATPSEGMRFGRWILRNDLGNPEDTIEGQDTLYVIVTDNVRADAEFDHLSWYYVGVYVNDTLGGTANQGHSLREGETFTATATANEGYTFSGWAIGIEVLDTSTEYTKVYYVASDTIVSTENPYTFTVTEDVMLVAVFTSTTTGISAPNMSKISIYDANGTITIRGAAGNNVYVFDALGRMTKHIGKANDTELVPVPTTGIYIVKIGDAAARKVAIIK